MKSLRELVVMSTVTMCLAASDAVGDVIVVLDITGGGETRVGSVRTIDTAQTAAVHFDVFSNSAHPSGVPLGPRNANIYIHKNTDTGDLAFGFVIGIDADTASDGTGTFEAVVASSTLDPTLTVSEDPGEWIESPENTFRQAGSNFSHANNTDGFVVDGLGGPDWSVEVDQVFNDATAYFVASGDGNHLSIDMTREYRLQLPEPGTGALLVLSVGLARGSWRRN